MALFRRTALFPLLDFPKHYVKSLHSSTLCSRSAPVFALCSYPASASFIALLQCSSKSSSFSSWASPPPASFPHEPPSSSPLIKSGDTLITIPRHAIQTSFSRSSGAGGQNVNKVNTKAEIRFHLGQAKWLAKEVKERLGEMYPTYLNLEGEIFISSQVHRSQEGNLEECFTKLSRMIRKAATAPKVRQIRTGLSELTKSTRRDDKRHRSDVKTRRKSEGGGGGDFDD